MICLFPVDACYYFTSLPDFVRSKMLLLFDGGFDCELSLLYVVKRWTPPAVSLESVCTACADESLNEP